MVVREERVRKEERKRKRRCEVKNKKEKQRSCARSMKRSNWWEPHSDYRHKSHDPEIRD